MPNSNQLDCRITRSEITFSFKGDDFFSTYLASMQPFGEGTISGFDHIASAFISFTEEGTVVGRVPLAYEGPNGLSKGAGSQFKHLPDGRFLVASSPANCVYVLSAEGERLATWYFGDGRPQSVSGLDFGVYRLAIGIRNIKYAFDEANNLLYLPLMTRKPEHLFDRPIVCALNINTGETNLLPISLPKNLTKAKYLTKTVPTVCVMEDGEMLVSFGCTALCYYYNTLLAEGEWIRFAPEGEKNIFSEPFTGNGGDIRQQFNYLKSQNYNDAYLHGEYLYRIANKDYDIETKKISSYLQAMHRSGSPFVEIPLSQDYRPILLMTAAGPAIQKQAKNEDAMVFERFRMVCREGG